MDFKKKLILLSSLIAVFTVTLIIGSLFNRESQSRKQREIPLYVGIDSSDVVFAEFTSPNNLIQLENTASSWQIKIDGILFPAKADKVKLVLDLILGLNNFRTVTSSGEDQERYGLDDSSAYSITLKNGLGNEIVSLKLGGTAGPGREVYGQLAGQTSVFVTDGSVQSYITQSDAQWSQLALFPEDIKVDSVYSLELEGELVLDEDEIYPLDYTITRASNSNKWIIKAGGQEYPANQTAVDSLIRSFITSSAGNFVTSAGEYGLDNPAVSLSLSLINGGTVKTNIGSRMEDTFYCNQDGSSYTYQVPLWTIRQWIKGYEDLVESGE